MIFIFGAVKDKMVTFVGIHRSMNLIFVCQDPSINISELKEIHSEINLTVPDPIVLPNLHDGLEAVSC